MFVSFNFCYTFDTQNKKITPFCVFVMAKTARDIMSLQSVSECVVVEIRALLRAPNDKELGELTFC